nr:hypothetical protein [Tanacetum cinerariifolium]
MDLNSSIRKICFGDDVVVISSDKVEGSGDWNSPEYQDTDVSKGNKVVNTLSFYRMETDEISERYIAPCFLSCVKEKMVKRELIVSLKGDLYFVKLIINPVEDDSEPGVILGRSFLRLAHGVVNFAGSHLTQEEAKKEAMAVRISQKFALLKEERPIRREANENALADTASNINNMPYRIYETLGREEMKKIDRGIRMINHTQAEALGKLSNVLSQVGRTAKSDRNDEEEYVIKRKRFGALNYGPKPTPYLNYTNMEDRSLAIQIVTNPF